jgi:hypothetical protein
MAELMEEDDDCKHKKKGNDCADYQGIGGNEKVHELCPILRS